MWRAFGINVKCSSPPALNKIYLHLQNCPCGLCTSPGVEGRSCLLALVFAEALTRLSRQELLLLHNMGLLQHGTAVSWHEGRGAGGRERSHGGLRVRAWGSFNPESRGLRVLE